MPTSLTRQDCMIGFNLADEGEASALYKKVSNRSKHAGALSI